MKPEGSQGGAGLCGGGCAPHVCPLVSPCDEVGDLCRSRMWWVCVHSTRVRMFLRFRQGDCVLQYPSGLINLPVEYVRKKTGR